MVIGANPDMNIGKTAHPTPSANAATDAINVATDHNNHVTLFGFVIPFKVSIIYGITPDKPTTAPTKIKYIIY